MKIGFIGQGYVGKNYADDFEHRGFEVVRYALEEPYRQNRDAIKTCDVVFIGVPTPTTPDGFDDSIVRGVIDGVGEGKIAIIKSTIVPGTTKDLHEQFPNIILLYSPEFLSEATAAHDAAHPFGNIIGIPENDPQYQEAANSVHAILPTAPFVLTCDSTEAEIIKYSHNVSAFTQIVTFNIIYDIAKKLGANWEPIENALKADPFICNRYASPVHKSGRGAGGNCFVKDFEAFSRLYKKILHDESGNAALEGLKKKNITLLLESKKDLKILEGVYGSTIYEDEM